MSKLVIGIDEAGYGPSMGPLVIAATVWRIPEDMQADELGDLCSPELQPKGLGKRAEYIPIGDSKEIYKGKLGWESLCCGARWLLENTQCDPNVEDWWMRLPALVPEDWERFSTVPWYQSTLNCSDGYAELNTAFASLATNALSKLNAIDVQLLDSGARIFDEPEFNRCVERTGNKATILSESSLELVKQLALRHASSGETIEIYCDKHGGRSRYQPVLMHCFDNEWFDIEIESQRLSRYRARWRGNDLRIQFRVEGDSLLPSAAASILAKWTREQSMNSLNRFWREKCREFGFVGEWRDTAGYYVDAERFSKTIADAARKLELRRDQWWRSR